MSTNKIVQLYDAGVAFLQWLALILNISYEALSVRLFGVAWPLLTILLIVMVQSRGRRIERIKQKYDAFA